jgi:beta-mannosidase
MKERFDLSQLAWTLSGYAPFLWNFERQYSMGISSAEIGPIPAPVPGSVQAALRDAGIVPDWNVAMFSRACEWVENRQWVYRTILPAGRWQKETMVRLHCDGLDYSGEIYLNGQCVAPFLGSHVPHVVNLTPHLRADANALEIVFMPPPRWLGQFGYTSQMREWKPRFNYTWDWIPRLVQIGIWDDIRLELTDGNELHEVRCVADADVAAATGILEISGTIGGTVGTQVRVTLTQGDQVLRSELLSGADFVRGVRWEGLPVALWWTNLEGEHPLYVVQCALLDEAGSVLDTVCKRVGFRHVAWQSCEAAPAEADPWVCVVNGRPIFCQGVNWAPIRPNFADLTKEDYCKRLRLYHDLGCNMLRINGVGFLEKEWLYDLCDEMGLLVWQDFPMSSSGIDNWPPEQAASIAEMAEIALSFIARRRHHPSLALWCGGNELQGDLAGNKSGVGKPVDLTHAMIRRLAEVVETHDPGRRFLVTSPSGPRAGAEPSAFGEGLHWEVHGPYITGSTEYLADYWKHDDALFRGEVSAPGSSPVEIIRRYAGECQVFPPTVDNPYWTRPTPWWNDWAPLAEEHGREPRDLDEYVAWSQARQARLLVEALRSCKGRFPRCGGVLLWEGHDTFPTPINNSVVDFHGNPKPAAVALAEVWKSPPSAGGAVATENKKA